MIGIDVFSGPGGMSLGASMAGINVRLAVEKDPYAAETYLKNHKSTTVIVDDIKNINDFRFNKGHEQIILFGGPPCQGYSNSNQKTRSKENPKNWLFKEFIRCAKLIKPDWIVMENVKGLANFDKGFFLDSICKDLNSIGYTVNVKILNAANFGVPQKRERLFIIGSLHGVACDFPHPICDKYVTIADAIFDLPSLLNGDMQDVLDYKPTTSPYAKLMRGKNKRAFQNFVTKNSALIIERYKHIPQGGNWKNIPAELMSNYTDCSRCHHGIYRRLKEDEPSTIIGNFRKNMLIHPKEDRGLSIREAARLQSFPDDYMFLGPLISQQQQVGDAVPPLLAKAIFKKIIEAA